MTTTDRGEVPGFFVSMGALRVMCTECAERMRTMKRNTVLLTIAIFMLATACVCADPTVSNVSASQRGDGSRLVDVYYDLAETLGDWPYVTLKISTDGGTTYSITPTSVTGDVNRNLAPGTGKHIVWDAKTDMPDVSGDNYKAQVSASTCIGYAGPMISIPAGECYIGWRSDESPQWPASLPRHKVSLTAYNIGKYEVTRAEYAKFIESGGYSTQSYWSADGWTWKTTNNRTQPDFWASQQTWGTPPGQFTQTGRHPVVGVSWYEAEAYCNWASQYLPAGETPYHLPTSAQWEKAARLRVETGYTYVWPWGDNAAVDGCNSDSDSTFAGAQTAPVGSYAPYGSWFDVQDAAGNVWEWCKDWYLDTYYEQHPPEPAAWADPQGPDSGTTRIVRGGAWDSTLDQARCAHRHHNDPATSFNSRGFRTAQ